MDKLIELFVKKGYSSEALTFLRTHGPNHITNIEVTRTPLSAKIDSLLNLVTLNKFTEAKAKAQYDKMFHLMIIVKTSNGRFQFEKNERIRLGKVYGITSETETKHVILDKTIPIWQLLARAEKQMGAHNFFVYSAFEHNCQDFVYNLLKASNILSEEVKRFVKQDALEVLKHLPSYTNQIANILTNLANIFSPEKSGEEVEEVDPSKDKNYIVVSVRIKKDKLSEHAAKHWLIDHHYNIHYPDQSLHFWHFRQVPKDIERLNTPKIVKIGDIGQLLVVYK